MAAARSGIHHRNALGPVCQQCHFADQGINACDLPHHAARINDRRTWHDAPDLSSVHHDAIGIRVGRFVKHFNRLGRPCNLCSQIKQLPQLGVFQSQLFNLLQTLGLRDGARLEVLCGILRLFQVVKVLTHASDRARRLQRQPLQGGQHNGNARTQRLGDLETVV